MELIDEIEELIMMHQEGSYWDFKREWYDDSKDGDLLIDIICMANNLVDRDAYIIIGVNEECLTVRSGCFQRRRKSGNDLRI